MIVPLFHFFLFLADFQQLRIPSVPGPTLLARSVSVRYVVHMHGELCNQYFAHLSFPILRPVSSQLPVAILPPRRSEASSAERVPEGRLTIYAGYIYIEPKPRPLAHIWVKEMSDMLVLLQET